MANTKLFNQNGVNLTQLSELYLRALIGATGAITSYDLQWGFGQNTLQATPLVRTGAGVYTVQLTEPFAGGIVWYSANTLQTVVNGATDGLFGQITGFASVPTTGQFTLTMENNATAATEIRNGATLLLSLGLKNNVNYP
jgi:hypothetical protein